MKENKFRDRDGPVGGGWVEVVNLDACDTGVTRCDLFQQRVPALPACSPASSTKFNACQPTSQRPHGVTQINTTESSYCSCVPLDYRLISSRPAGVSLDLFSDTATKPTRHNMTKVHLTSSLTCHISVSD